MPKSRPGSISSRPGPRPTGIVADRVASMVDLTDSLIAQAEAIRDQSEAAARLAGRGQAPDRGRGRGDDRRCRDSGGAGAGVAPERGRAGREDPPQRRRPELRPGGAEGSAAGARLLATQMAVSGSSREEIAARLRNGFEIEDTASILDAILGPEELEAMHEDPTRLMGQPEDRGPDGHKPHGNMRLLVACLVAVIVGLVIAVIVIAGSDDSGSSTASSSESVTTLPSTPKAPSRRPRHDGADHDRVDDDRNHGTDDDHGTDHHDDRNDAARQKKKTAAAASRAP